MKFQKMNLGRVSAINFAAGVARQIPFIPKRAGRISMVISMNTKELEKASTSEAMP
jgi:hypothetical protein